MPIYKLLTCLNVNKLMLVTNLSETLPCRRLLLWGLIWSWNMLFCIIYNVLSTLLQLCCCFFIVSGVVILYLKFTSSWEMSCIISLPSLGGTTNGSFCIELQSLYYRMHDIKTFYLVCYSVSSFSLFYGLMWCAIWLDTFSCWLWF